jgi:hypothetical protein
MPNPFVYYNNLLLELELKSKNVKNNFWTQAKILVLIGWRTLELYNP